MKNWKKDIRILANDFCLNRAKVEAAINEVEKSCSGLRSSEYCYNKCYAMIKPLIMAI